MRMDGREEGMLPWLPFNVPLNSQGLGSLVALAMLAMGQSGHPLQPRIPVPKAPAVFILSANTDHRTWLNMAFYP